MDYRHLFAPSEPLGAQHPPLDSKLELQQLRTRRRELTDKWMLECVHYHSQIKEIQTREEELLEELLRQPNNPEASTSMQYKAQVPAIPSAYATEISTLPFGNCQLQQLLNCVPDSVHGVALGPSPHPRDDASREAADGGAMIRSGSSMMLSTSGPTVASSKSSKRPSVSVGEAAKPTKEKKLNSISFEQLSEHVANIANACDESTGEFTCPVCGRTKKESKYNSLRHLLEHLNEKEYHPYKCPVVEGCATTSVRSDVVRAHVVNVHKLEWTDELKAASADAEKKAASADAEKKAVLDSMLKRLDRVCFDQLCARVANIANASPTTLKQYPLCID